MARIRTVKPEFWTDEKVVECSFEARLMFIGMFNFADDKGNLARSPKRIKMQIFPADMIDCEPLIKELTVTGLIAEYSVSGVEYIHIKGFTKHQKINRPSATTIPTPADGNEGSRNENSSDDVDSVNESQGKGADSLSSNGHVNDDSVSAHSELTDGKEGKGREKESIKTTLSEKVRTDGENESDSENLPAPKPDNKKPDPVDQAFESIFWIAGLRKDTKVKARSAFKTKYREHKAKTGDSPEQFATILADDIRWRVKAQVFGTDKLLPTSYLSGERWNDERPAPTTAPSGGASKPLAQDGETQVFIDYDAMKARSR
ncbi:hypothetical protein [Rahnella inusitata]|uniref:hypothetical protein n=1 Tax=Rahnella inusitata TaxID=58169 RepID=UPI0039AF5C80